MPDGSQPSIYECSICHQTFATAAELYGHITIEHPEKK